MNISLSSITIFLWVQPKEYPVQFSARLLMTLVNFSCEIDGVLEGGGFDVDVISDNSRTARPPRHFHRNAQKQCRESIGSAGKSLSLR